jgi:hypothetical protein
VRGTRGILSRTRTHRRGEPITTFSQVWVSLFESRNALGFPLAPARAQLRALRALQDSTSTSPPCARASDYASRVCKRRHSRRPWSREIGCEFAAARRPTAFAPVVRLFNCASWYAFELIELRSTAPHADDRISRPVSLKTFIHQLRYRTIWRSDDAKFMSAGAGRGPRRKRLTASISMRLVSKRSLASRRQVMLCRTLQMPPQSPPYSSSKCRSK